MFGEQVVGKSVARLEVVELAIEANFAEHFFREKKLRPLEIVILHFDELQFGFEALRKTF